MSVAIQPPAAVPRLAFTGERIVPGMVPAALFCEHEARYQFAAKYVRGKVVLDVACGTGIGTRYLVDAGANKCTGLDIDLETIRYARTEYHGCSFAVGDAGALPLTDEAADVVVSFETLEHVPDPPAFLAECNRVLRPGGILVCSTPNHQVYRWYGRNPFHQREFNSEEFVRLLRQRFAGLEVYSQKPAMYPIFVTQRVVSTLLKRLRLIGVAKALLRPGSARISNAKRFCARAKEQPEDIKPYISSWLVQPIYLLVVAQKSG